MLYKNITTSGAITDYPATVKSIIVNSNTSGSFRIYDDTSEGVEFTPVTGTYTPTTATSEDVYIDATCKEAVFVSIGGTANLTVIYSPETI